MLRICQNLIFSIIFILSLLTISASAETNIMFVLDVSGSMAQKIGNETKMTVAKRAFGNLVDNMPSKTYTGLYVYGHHGDKDCSAIENIVPLGQNNGAKMKQAVAGLQPSKGATPLTNAIFLGTKSLVEDGKGDRALVLISDGKETCGVDPIEFMTKLSQNMPADQIVKYYVIGLGVDADSKAQLEKIATLGGGAYYSAGNEKELTAALTKVTNTMVKTVLFKDDFNDEFLNESWEIINPDEDSMIIEDGYLQILTGVAKGSFFNPENFILLKQKLSGQYEIILKMKYSRTDSPGGYNWGSAQTAGIMLFKDKQNAITLAASNNWGNSTWNTDAVHFAKMRKNKWQPGFSANYSGAVKERNVTLRIQHLKRKFIASFKNEKGKWQKIGEYTELRPNYRVGIFAARGGNAHEDMEMFDSFTLNKIE